MWTLAEIPRARQNVKQLPASALVAVSSPVEVRRTLDRHCVTCHNGRLKTAGLELDSMDVNDIRRDAARWEQVVRKLRSGAMPPPGSPRPERRSLDLLVGSLEAALDRAAASEPNPGRLTVHRLNRTEYGNAVHDLLALDIDPRTLFPADDTGYGFDNIADVLSISPLLLERYFTAAGLVSRLAVGDPSMAPSSQTYTAGKYIRQDDRRSEELPFGSRGGLAVHHYFPVDGEYVLKVYLDRTYQGNVRGMAERHQLEVRLDGHVIGQFTVGGPSPNPVGDPNRPTGTSPAPRQRLTADQIAERAARIVEQAQFAGQLAEQDHSADAHLFVRFSAKAGPAVLGVSFVATDTLHEGARRPTLMITSYEYAGNTVGSPLVSSIDVRGPYNVTGRGDTPSRSRIFTCRPAVNARADQEERCASDILRTLARRAYRRPVGADDLSPLIERFRSGRRENDFDTGVQLAIERMLVSPAFLFRVVEPPATSTPGGTYRLTDLQLASRLSFFLWSSLPDEELLDLAERSKLSDPKVFPRQVRRMLADRRASALVSNFAGQWLMLRNLKLATPDPYEFPEFDDNLREALQGETTLFIESQLRDDRPVLELLTADYTFVNERLAKHYGIPNVYGSQFRRVAWSDERRHGLLGHASVLTITSYPNRTAPTIRGKFLLENVLGTPPPPPPPDVPQLEESTTQRPRSVRERLEHRSNPVCASCHRNMDPLGLALEHFDALGRYRTHDNGSPIDASGVMPDGSNLDGPSSLRQALVARSEQFVETVTEKLLTYAVGRGVEYYDRPAIRRIVRASAANGHRWSDLVMGIAGSLPFRMAVDERPTQAASVKQPDKGRSQEP
jgi:hypothetical protein